MNKDEKIYLKACDYYDENCCDHDDFNIGRGSCKKEICPEYKVDGVYLNKPSCSTCGDSGEDRTGENPDEVYPCPDCQEQKQQSDITIDEAREFLLEVNDKHFNDRTFQSYISNRLAGDYGIEIALYIKSQQSRIDELQEKLKVAEELLREGVKMVEGFEYFIEIDSKEYSFANKTVDFLSTIKGETE